MEQISVTLQEAVYGFLIGVVLGVVFGIGLGSNRLLADLSLARSSRSRNSIPRIVLGSIFTVAFGFGIESKIVLAVVLVFFGVFFNAFQGTREVDRNLMSNARILGASRFQVTRQVVLPSAFTWILASLHISFGFALIGAIVGEILGCRQGPRPADPQLAEQLRHERRTGRHGRRRHHRPGRRAADHPAGEAHPALATAHQLRAT